MLLGLCAIKNSVDHGSKVFAFEFTKYIGSTWVYIDDVGKGKYGNDIYFTMYKGLVTNNSKEIMGFSNIPFLNQENSYITPQDNLIYYDCYTAKFHLLKYINLNIMFYESVAWLNKLGK